MNKAKICKNCKFDVFINNHDKYEPNVICMKRADLKKEKYILFRDMISAVITSARLEMRKMGITLKCKKTGTSYDLGYFGFLKLREKVAVLCNPEFGEHYQILYQMLYYTHSVEEERIKIYQDFNKKTAEMLRNKIVSVKVVDFCLQSDCKGKIRYGACKEIYKHIKHYDDNHRYSNAMTFKDFKNLILECYENKSDLI